MKLKILANNVLYFGINRVIEIIGVAILLAGAFLLVSLITFSPDDPNFIFLKDVEIKNILGFRGSFTADIFFQSFGVVAILIPFSLLISGANIIINKKIILIIESFFYTILYSLIGSLFFSFFYPIAFKLYINGNGGFVGKYLNTTFLNSMISINPQIFYYILTLLILIIFLISIQFKINSFFKFIRKIFQFLFSKKQKNYTNENEIISEFIPQEEIKNLIQEDLPFINNKTKINNKHFKFIYYIRKNRHCSRHRLFERHQCELFSRNERNSRG